MADSQLPKELEQLEYVLAHRPHEDPPAELRSSVMDAMQVELRRQRPRTGWWTLAAMAAAAVLWLNLSLSATNATDGHLSAQGSQQPLRTLAGQIRELLPEISSEEAWRQALVLQTASAWTPCPELRAKPLRKVQPDFDI